MKTQKTFLMFLIFLQCVGYASAAFTPVWRKRTSSMGAGKVYCLFTPSKGESYILAGTDSSIYRAEDAKSPFIPVLQNQGQSFSIHQITQNTQVSSSIYSATDSGVFVSVDQGKTWTNIFSSLNPLTRKSLCVLADAQAIYVGTANGLYFRRNDQQTWQQNIGQIGHRAIFSLVNDAQYIYAATDREIYRIQKVDQQTQRIYSRDDRLKDEDSLEPENGEFLEKQIKDMIILPNSKGLIVATAKEIIFSTDQGESWKKFVMQGLPVNCVRKLSLDTQGNIFAATEEGAFVYKDDRWQSDVLGLADLLVNDIKPDQNGNLFLASDEGIYTKVAKQTLKMRTSGVDVERADFKNDPTIREVQRMAIAYANVHPDQINNWHNQARVKALLPTLSVGLNRGDGEMFHWDAGPNPDVLAKGRDYLDWSTSLSWDFSNLIWSSDQTTIDARSKLMNELRQDILDQVTRLYFERRRLQIELAQEFDLASEDYRDKEIRLEELTALLDGLTGGKFTNSQE